MPCNKLWRAASVHDHTTTVHIKLMMMICPSRAQERHTQEEQGRLLLKQQHAAAHLFVAGYVGHHNGLQQL